LSHELADYKDILRPMNRRSMSGYSYRDLQALKGTSMSVARIFTSHPAKVGETYLSHMAFDGWFSSRLLLAAGAALVHAFLPFLFETTASRIVRELYERTHNRGTHAAKEPAARMDRA
jgi:hypothetical protein